MFLEFLKSTYVDKGISVLFDSLSILAEWAPLWLPLVLLAGLWRLWVTYLRAQTIADMEWSLLEIILPREIDHSPLAMELVLNALHQTSGEGTWLKKYWEGGLRPWFSLELVSLEGGVHFFIRTPNKNRGLLESNIYSQYPDVEIQEVSDYSDIVYDEDKLSMHVFDFGLTKPDPYPIKTYVDYGLDKDPKEEYKIDPMTPMLEWLGSLTKGEQAWIQILVRAHKDEDSKLGELFSFKTPFFGEKGIFGKKGPIRGKANKWEDDVKTEVEKIIKGRKIKSGGEEEGPIKLTRVEEETINALERSVTKNGFDVGIRGVYIAEQDVFNGSNIGGLAGSWKQYGSNNLNGFKPVRETDFDFPWQDLTGRRVAKKRMMMFDAYRRRSWFHPPYKYKHFVLNSEELATIYHFPGRVAATPTFKRLESRKGEPPTGLPL